MDADRQRVGVGVAALVFRGDQLLMLRRRHVHGDGTWSTPGGHVDFGESLEQTATRETLEETGLVVVDARFVGVTNDVMPDDGKHYVTVWMRCDYTGGEPRVADAHEMSEVAWYPRDALPSPLFVPLANLVAGRSLGTAASGGWLGLGS